MVWGAVLALICLSPIGQVLAVVGMISVIGIPIALLVFVTPGIIWVSMIAQLIRRGLQAYGPRVRVPLLACFALALLLLAIPPLLINRGLDARVADLVANDSVSLLEAPKIDTLAVIYRSSARQVSACDELCQRLLLNNQVRRVIVAGVGEDEAPDGSHDGRAYRWGKRALCPSVELTGSTRNFDFEGSDTGLDRRSPADLIRLEAVKGNCVIASDAKTDDADTVVFHGMIKRGESDYRAGFDLFADTVSAGRLALYTKAGEELVKSYQATTTSTAKLLPVLIPTLIGSHGLQYGSGFARSTTYTGGATRQEVPPLLQGFFEDKLGMELTVRGQATGQRVRQTIVEILDQSMAAMHASQVAVIEDYFEDFSWNPTLDSTDAFLVLRILRDRRVPVPLGAARAVRKIPTDEPALVAEFADVLFERLAEFEPDMEQTYVPSRYKRLDTISDAIAALPEGTLGESDQAFDQLKELAKDPLARVYSYQALKRLADFKERAIPSLLYLISDAYHYKDKKRGSGNEPSVPNQWQHPYLAGLQGLCVVGRNGTRSEAAVAQLFSWLDEGALATHASYWDLTINTLVALGSGPESIWSHLQSTEDQYNRERFDSEITKTKRKIDCSY